LRKIASRSAFAPAQWLSAADLVASRMKQAAEHGAVEEEHAGIPAAIYHQVLAFLTLALEAKLNPHSPRFGRERGAYRLVAESVRKQSRPTPVKREKVVETVKEYKELLERFEKPGPLSEDDVDTARSAHDFFVRLSKEGEAEIFRQDARAHLIALSRRP